MQSSANVIPISPSQDPHSPVIIDHTSIQPGLSSVSPYTNTSINPANARCLSAHSPGFEAFEPWPFKIYSGYLTVPGPFKLNKYDSLHIHYQLHTAQKSPARAPVVTWHQGGPGGSSIAVGLYTEMGFLQIDDQGMHTNEYAWNKIANMLYLESPAGSGDSHGFSTCVQGSQPTSCEWDDVSQAEAYAHTLAAFYRAFPEYSSNPLYLTGESYFGQVSLNLGEPLDSDHSPSSIAS